MGDFVWFRVHPAMLTPVADAEEVQALRDEHLGSAWASVSDERRFGEERRYFLRLLQMLRAARGVLSFELEVDPSTLDVGALEDSRTERSAVFRGEVTDAVSEVLVSVAPIRLVVSDSEGNAILVVNDAWSGTRARLSNIELDQLRPPSP